MRHKPEQTPNQNLAVLANDVYRGLGLDCAVATISVSIRGLLSFVEPSRARTYFRLGLEERRRRDCTGSPYLTEGFSEADFTARAYEMIEVLGTDLADLCEEANVEVAGYFEEADADQFLRGFAGLFEVNMCYVDASSLTRNSGTVGHLD